MSVRGLLLALALAAAGCETETDIGVPGIDPADLEDKDGDGWSVHDGDCDDEDAFVAPDQDEVCDGLDNDCDDEIDPVGACERVETFEQRLELDVLFVVDRSPGMADLQARLSDGVAVFAPSVLDAEADTRVGVTAADAAGELQTPFGHEWATRRMPDASFVDWLEAALVVGTGGGAPTVRAAIDASLGSAFHRPDAFLMVIAASESDDASDRPGVDELADTFERWKGVGRVAVHGVVPGDTCDQGPALQHEALVNRTGGTLVDVCHPDADLASSLATSLQSAAQDGLATRFPLAEPAWPDTIRVALKRPGDDEFQDWAEPADYEPDPPTVVLAVAPPRDSWIRIRYDRRVD